MKDIANRNNTNLLKRIPEEARNHCSWRLTNINRTRFQEGIGGEEEDVLFKHH